MADIYMSPINVQKFYLEFFIFKVIGWPPSISMLAVILYFWRFLFITPFIVGHRGAEC